MNIWDSVQRGLEKASQEAARIAKTQKLRSTIDGLSRQSAIQKDTLIARTMELFATGHLQDTELIPLCQELTNLQRQLELAQSELKALQTQAQATQGGQIPAPPPAQMGSTMPYFTSSSQFPPPPEYTAGAGGEVAPTVYAPPPPEYQQFSEAPPPPPPGASPPTMSSMETLRMQPGPQYPPTPSGPIPPVTNPPTLSSLETLALGGKITKCPRCQTELIPGNVYCHNCGLFVQQDESAHLPTMRGGTLEQLYPSGQPTVYVEKGAEAPEPPSGPRSDAPSSHADKTVAAQQPFPAYEKTVAAEQPVDKPPYPFNASPKPQDGGQ